MTFLIILTYAEELDGGPTPFQTFAVQRCGHWKFRVFRP